MDKFRKDIEIELEKAWEEEYKEIPEAERNLSWNKFKTEVFHKDAGSIRSRYYKAISGVAAALMLLLGGYYFFELHNPIVHYSNNSPSDMEINLPDGSLVRLKRGSEIKYKKNFEGARQVRLLGQAFFEVVKDNGREFHVVTESSIVKVLGTAFSVVEEAGSERFEISLYSGRVMVSIEDEEQSWGIVPGEKLIYNDGTALIEEFDTNLSFESGNEFIDVDNIKLEKLYDFLGKRFGYTIEDNPSHKNKRVTLRINKSDSMENVLEILSVINSTTYEIDSKSKKITVKQ